MEEKTKITRWKVTDNRFVAFLDILGFKDMVARNSHHEIYQLLQKLSEIKETVQKAPVNPKIKKQVGDVEVFVVNFSDSIVIFSKNDDINNFHYFILATRWIFTSAIKNGIPIKGGFAHGNISVNKTEQIYFGQPIIDAYLIEEEVNYFGIVAHNSIDKYVSSIRKDENQAKFSDVMFEAVTPLKCGKIVHTNINWFRIMKPTNFEELRKKIEDFRFSSTGSPRRYIDNTLEVLEGIKETILFADLEQKSEVNE
jgi:hypothetical protein